MVANELRSRPLGFYTTVINPCQYRLPNFTSLFLPFFTFHARSLPFRPFKGVAAYQSGLYAFGDQTILVANQAPTVLGGNPPREVQTPWQDRGLTPSPCRCKLQEARAAMHI